MRALALRALIGSIALSALTGIYVLVAGGQGDLEGQVLTTALSLSVLSILVMSCGAGLERRKLGLLPQVGTAAGIAAFILLMTVVWKFAEHRAWVQCGLSLALASGASALACLLSLAALAPRFRWVRALGFVSNAGLATLLTLIIWEILDGESELISRTAGVLAILLGAVTVAVPILQRMSSSRETAPDTASTGGAGRVGHCVVCGKGLSGTPSAEVACAGCGARFKVAFLPR